MGAIVLTALVTCLSCLFVGQAALRICGAAEWNWLAPPIGLSVLMMASISARHVPGNAYTVAVILGIATAAAIVWCMSTPAHRPPLGGLLAATPVAFLVLIPFLAAGTGGILGVSFDNDMAAHLKLAEIFFTSHPDPTTAGLAEYPVGPHAMSAVLAKGLHVRIDHSFTGWTMAIPVLNGLTALALVRRAAWFKQVLVATLVGIPFLVAAYFGEGSFKEPVQAGLVLATALFFADLGPSLRRGKWVPLALLIGGMLSVYSVTGLPWPAAFGAVWLVGVTVIWVHREGIAGLKDKAVATVRAELAPVAVALGVLIVGLIPQIRRLHNFVIANFGNNGIVVPKNVLGNLTGPLPGWEAFGVWGNPDFRLAPTSAFTSGMWTALVVGLVLFGTWWFMRRGRWILPLAAAVSMLIWAWSIHSQSPYTVAKALVIASPLLMVLAVVPLVEMLPDRLPRSLGSLFRGVPGQPFSWAVAGALLIVLFLKVGWSDVSALRASPVGPPTHADELRELRPYLHDRPTLYLGNDDFLKWEMSPVPVKEPWAGGIEEVPIRAEKDWQSGDPLDFDTVGAAALNEFEYVITTADRAGSQPPPQMHLVKSTRNFQLWRRVGKVRERSVLPEGEGSGGVLDCTSPEGRKILRGGGVAAVRPAPVVVAGAPLDPGGVVTIELPLVPAVWTLESSYVSRLPITVTGHGLHTTLDANLDRPGPRWPIGKVVVRKPETVDLTFAVDNNLLAPNQVVTEFGNVTATPKAPEKVVSVRQACGEYVDWYRGGSR
jgi:hypothetical protein